MGGTCACLQTPSSGSFKANEIDFMLSSETYPDLEQIHNSTLINPKLLKRIIKERLVRKYFDALKNPLLFKVPHSFSLRSLKSTECETVKMIEQDYGEYRITPVWGELTIPLPPIKYNQTIYQGEWHFFSKIPHGSGISYNVHTFEKYSGNFNNGKRHGLGRLIQESGDIYEGEFFDNEMHGNGTLLHFQGKVYFGEFQKGVKHGFGKEQDRHDTCYEGEFSSDRRNGRGKLIWGDGRCYIGEFLDDKMHGKGECWWPEVKKYYGDWEKNHMHGLGECIWDDGREYNGYFYKGLEDGKGKMVFTNGDSFEGMWRAGKMHGRGIMLQNGQAIKGEWADGELVNRSG